MTNEQLKILLQRIANNLKQAINVAERKLKKAEIKRNDERVYIGSPLPEDPSDTDYIIYNLAHMNPKNFEIQATTSKALNQARKVLESLEEDIKSLEEV